MPRPFRHLDDDDSRLIDFGPMRDPDWTDEDRVSEDEAEGENEQRRWERKNGEDRPC